jgi:hypothetical protein
MKVLYATCFAKVAGSLEVNTRERLALSVAASIGLCRFAHVYVARSLSRRGVRKNGPCRCWTGDGTSSLNMGSVERLRGFAI